MACATNAAEDFHRPGHFFLLAEQLHSNLVDDQVTEFDRVLLLARTECAEQAFHVEQAEPLESSGMQRVDQVRDPLTVYESLDLLHGVVSLANRSASFRSEERRGGKGCVSRVSSGWSPDH